MSSLKKIYSFISYEYLFVILSTIVNIFFVLYFFGFLKNQNSLVERISFYLKIFIGLFLVVKFNPFYTFSAYGDKFTDLDKKIVFSAGLYITVINFIVLYNDYSIGKDNVNINNENNKNNIVKAV
jgi:hypothetical protein